MKISFVIGFVCFICAFIFGAYALVGYVLYQGISNPTYYAHKLGETGKALKDGYNGL
jgi:hypothetical protein